MAKNKPAQTGDPVIFSASRERDIDKMLNAFNSGKIGGGIQDGAYEDGVTCWVTNGTGENLKRFELVVIDKTNAANYENDWRALGRHKGIKPTGAVEDGQRVAIYQNAVLDTRQAEARIAGTSLAYVDITDVNHKFADTTEDGRTLISTDSGPFLIVDFDGETGLKICKVAWISGGGGCGVFRINANLQNDTCGNVPYYTARRINFTRAAAAADCMVSDSTEDVKLYLPMLAGAFTEAANEQCQPYAIGDLVYACPFTGWGWQIIELDIRRRFTITTLPALDNCNDWFVKAIKNRREGCNYDGTVLAYKIVLDCYRGSTDVNNADKYEIRPGDIIWANYDAALACWVAPECNYTDPLYIDLFDDCEVDEESAALVWGTPAPFTPGSTPTAITNYTPGENLTAGEMLFDATTGTVTVPTTTVTELYRINANFLYEQGNNQQNLTVALYLMSAAQGDIPLHVYDVATNQTDFRSSAFNGLLRLPSGDTFQMGLAIIGGSIGTATFLTTSLEVNRETFGLVAPTFNVATKGERHVLDFKKGRLCSVMPCEDMPPPSDCCYTKLQTCEDQGVSTTECGTVGDFNSCADGQKLDGGTIRTFFQQCLFWNLDEVTGEFEFRGRICGQGGGLFRPETGTYNIEVVFQDLTLCIDDCDDITFSTTDGPPCPVEINCPSDGVPSARVVWRCPNPIPACTEVYIRGQVLHRPEYSSLQEQIVKKCGCNFLFVVKVNDATTATTILEDVPPETPGAICPTFPEEPQNYATFNGTSSVINAPQSAILNSTDFVDVELWFRGPTATGAGGLVTKATTVGQQQSWFLFRRGTGALAFRLSAGGGTESQWDLDSLANVDDNQWYKARAIYDGQITTSSLYIGGVLQQQRTNVPANLFASSQNVQVGVFSQLSPAHFNGDIGQVIMRNRAGDIILHYPLTSDANDISGNGLDGTPTDITFN